MTKQLSVKITTGKTHRISGVAYRNADVTIKLVLPRKPTRLWHGGKWCITADSLDLAYRFWRVVAHEWGHVLDYQAMIRGEKREFIHYDGSHSIRAINHDDRPQEKRANQYAKDAEASMAGNPKYDNVILALAEWFEG